MTTPEHDDIRFVDLDPSVKKFLNELDEKDIAEIEAALKTARKTGIIYSFLKIVFWGIVGSIISFSAFSDGIIKLIGLFK